MNVATDTAPAPHPLVRGYTDKHAVFEVENRSHTSRLPRQGILDFVR